MKLRLEYAFLMLAALLFSISTLHAEDNKNYADCEVCRGGIHYGPEEAKEILGQGCFDLFVLIRRFHEADMEPRIAHSLQGMW